MIGGECTKNTAYREFKISFLFSLPIDIIYNYILKFLSLSVNSGG